MYSDVLQYTFTISVKTGEGSVQPFKLYIIYVLLEKTVQHGTAHPSGCNQRNCKAILKAIAYNLVYRLTEAILATEFDQLFPQNKLLNIVK